VPQYAFVTSQGCTDAIAATLADPSQRNALLYDLVIGNYTYPIDNRVVNVVPGSNGLGYLTVSPTFAKLFENLDCQTPACVYNDAMKGDINYSDCTIVSYGSTDATTRAQTGLHSVKVSIDLFCSGVTEAFGANSVCFRALSGDDLICSGDAGAPVYCKANSNNEDILIGVAGTVTTCGGDNGRVPLIPLTS